MRTTASDRCSVGIAPAHLFEIGNAQVDGHGALELLRYRPVLIRMTGKARG
jgi:hypothetical protein